jgi:hypothetical protein
MLFQEPLTSSTEQDLPLALCCFSVVRKILGKGHHCHDNKSLAMALFGASTMQFGSTQSKDPIYFIISPMRKAPSVCGR